MPYIKQENRDIFSDIDLIHHIETSGELNYCITRLCNIYMSDKVKNYTCFNTIVGALESAKLEFYRRVVVPYENLKCEDNGDCY